LDTLALTDRPGASPSGAPTLLMASSQGSMLSLRRPGPGAAELHMHAHWNALFAQAVPGRDSVVLLVHGFGKGFFAAASQATELRVRYPSVKAGLFTWPSQAGSGWVGALGFGATLQSAEQSAPSLATALATFCEAAQRHPDVPAVVLVRSLGAVVLARAAHLLRGWPTQALKRIVLSAPACDAKRLQWMDTLLCEVVATVNQNDRTLGLADWVHNGPFLGHSCKRDSQPRLVVLDCTHVPGVDRAHDYLWRAVNQGLFGLNQMLLAGRPLTRDTVQGTPGLMATRNGQPWSGS
jgi:esterase/lipase superfamily enzyme